MSWIKIACINLVVFIGVWGSVEGLYALYHASTFHERCEPNWIAYGYCSGIQTSHALAPQDGGRAISIRTDDLGGRTGGRESLAHNPDVQAVLVGDSFIQAHQIPFDQTLSSLLTTQYGIKTYALGYSSWNPIQYYDAIKKIGLHHTHYVVFLMGNDVNPNYARSVYGELNGPIIASSSHGIWKILSKTFSYHVYERLRGALGVDKEFNRESFSAKIANDFRGFGEGAVDTCQPLNDLMNTEYSDSIGIDYAVYAKRASCWNAVYTQAYDLFKERVQKIVSLVTGPLESQITFVWVVPGWAFPNQNTVGRLNPTYQFPIGITVTQKGIVDQIRADLPNQVFLDTEDVIQGFIDQCKADCANRYYFALDGHWTAQTHRDLAGVLAPILRQRNGEDGELKTDPEGPAHDTEKQRP